MNARQKAKKYRALYEMVVKKPIPVVVRTSTQPITTLKASVIVSPEEMEAGIPFKTILARKFSEKLEDYIVITSERDPEGLMHNNYIRFTGTIEIVGGKE